MTRTQWLPELPRDWRVARLQHLAATATSNVDKHSVVGQPAVRLCNYVDVYKNDAITPNMDFMTATATPEQIARFALRRGDVVITKDSETSDDIGVPAFVTDSAQDLVCGYHLSIVRPHERVADPRFLYWLLESDVARAQWRVLATGVTRVGLKTGDIARLQVPLPPRPQQRAIADYLDRETAQIDTLIEEQRRFQPLLAERRASLIDEGLFGTCASEGSVPLKRMIRAVEQGVSPQAEGRLAEEPGSWGVLKSGCVNRGQFRPEEHKRLDDNFRFDQQLEVKAGDLLVSRASGSPDLVGSAGIVTPSKYRLILSDKTFRLVPEDSYSAAYLHLLLNSSRYREQVKAALSGADGLANNLPLSRLLNMRFPVLMGPAQAETVQRVVSELSKIDRTLSEVEKFVALTRERRAALITAAVTGAVDLETI